jgi:hypothetical protein
MKNIFLLFSAVLALVGLIVLQLNILKRHHPNAELLIGLFKMLNTNQKIPGDNSHGTEKSPVHLRPQQWKEPDGRSVFK